MRTLGCAINRIGVDGVGGKVNIEHKLILHYYYHNGGQQAGVVCVLCRVPIGDNEPFSQDV